MAQFVRTTPAFPAPPEPGAAPLDRAAAAVAGRQFGVITYAQLLECGLSRERIQQRVRAGQLQRIWRGVYAFGHRDLRPEGHLLGAVLACGPGAVLSHRSAADLWGLLGTARSAVDVTVPGHTGRPRRRGIDLHRVRRLDSQDVTKLDKIPVTSAARTLVDLCAVVRDRQVEKALDQAYVLRLIQPGALEDAIGRARGRRTRPLRMLLAAEPRAAALTRSELEERFLALVRRGELPDPEVNATLVGYEVDFLWRKPKRVVEVDGYAYHSIPGAFERDRRRDVDLELAGYRVTRFTYRQVVVEPEDTLRRVRRLVLGQ